MDEQTFFIDLYGYEDYNQQPLTDDFLACGDYLECDATTDNLTATKNRIEDNGGLITEFFVKQRVIKGTPLFEHLAKWGKIKIILD